MLKQKIKIENGENIPDSSSECVCAKHLNWLYGCVCVFDKDWKIIATIRK